MRKQYEIGRAAELAIYPEWGPADSATVSVYSSGDSAFVEDEIATVDPLSETATVKLGADSVTMDATSIVVGERYWLSSEHSLGYEVRFRGSHTNHAYLLDASRVDGDGHDATVQGLRVSYTLDAAHTASRARFVRVVWRLTYGAIVRTISEFVDFVRMPFFVPITEDDLEGADPRFGAHGGQGRGWDRLVERGRSDIWSKLVSWGMKPDLLRNREILTSCLVYRVHQLRHIHSNDTLFQHYGELYREELATLKDTARIWYDKDDDLARVEYDPDNEHDPSARYAGEAGDDEMGKPTRYLGVS